MTDYIERAREVIVTVKGGSNGSGVLVQPCSGDYSYVFTAKHVIRIDEKLPELTDAPAIEVLNHQNQKIEVVAVHVDPDHDIAILVIPRIPGITTRTAVAMPSRDENVLFYGYPENRRQGNPEDRLREFYGRVATLPKDRMVLRLEDVSFHDHVVGASGGAIFRIVENDIFLCGIEYRMEGEVNVEFNGRVVGCPLSFFSAVLKREHLSPLYPEAMASFLGLVNDTFTCLEDVDNPENIRFLRSKLHGFIKQIIGKDEINPAGLAEKMCESLLVNESPPQHLHLPALWVAYLEFLSIACLVDETQLMDFPSLEESNKRRKFLFAARKENWIQFLPQIFNSDFRGLMPGGVVVVGTFAARSSLQPEGVQFQRVVSDISRASKSLLLVDEGIRNPGREFKFRHLAELHRVCVMANENEYSSFGDGEPGFDVPELFKKVRDAYHAYI